MRDGLCCPPQAAGHRAQTPGKVGCEPGIESKLRVLSTKHRTTGFSETGNRCRTQVGRGRRQTHSGPTLDRPPPERYANWSAPLLSRESGDVHEQYNWRFLRAQKTDVLGRESRCWSTDPEFVAKRRQTSRVLYGPRTRLR